MRKSIPDGTPVFIPLEVAQTRFNTDMCVSDISVGIDIDHLCTSQLELTLYGPGSPTRDASYLANKNAARAEPTVLFSGYNGTDWWGRDVDEGCGNGMVGSFSDSAEESVWRCCGTER